MKILSWIAVGIVGVILTFAIAIQIVYVDSPSERQRDVSLILSEKRTVLEESARQFVKLKKVKDFVLDDNSVIIWFFENPDEVEILELDLKYNKYYVPGTDQSYGTLEEVLAFLELSKEELRYWMDFLRQHKLYAIGAGWEKEYVEFTFDRFHIVPHGLIYVFRCEDQNYFFGQIPGRIRGDYSVLYDVMAYLGNRWFYYEGP